LLFKKKYIYKEKQGKKKKRKIESKRSTFILFFLFVIKKSFEGTQFSIIMQNYWQIGFLDRFKRGVAL
jgi:hypothetical protein